MSRTYKDRPYRVKVNEDGVYRTASHNHERLGEEVFGSHVVHDSHGNIIYDEVPVMKKVRHAIHSVPKFIQITHENVKLSADSDLRYIDNLMPYVEKKINPLYQEIFNLYNDGKLDKMVQIGTEKRARTVKFKRFAVKDHCTVNEAWDGHWHGEQPCYKGLPAGYPQPGHTTGWEKAARRNDKRRERSRRRHGTKQFVNEANSGEVPDENEKAVNEIAEGETRNGYW